MSCWEYLPSDLADTVSKRFDSSYATCVRFGAVCKSWRHHIHNKSTPRPQIPWLMLPYKEDGSTLRGFYCPVDKTTYYLDQPAEAIATLCRGSFEGWVVNVERGPGLQLLNPLSKVLIQLPPITTFPYIIDYDPNRVDREYCLEREREPGKTYHLPKLNVHDMYVQKVCASNPPNSTTFDHSRSVFMAIYGEHYRLAFCKPGDENWTCVTTTVNAYSQFDDVVFHNGKFYAGRLDMVLECDPQSLLRPRRISLESPYSTSPPPDSKIYLFSDDEGGLVMVLRFFTGKGGPVDGCNGRVFLYHTAKFEIFKLVLDEDGCDEVKFKCSKVTSLGDKALFLGANSPILVTTSASGMQGVEGNRIYYTDNNWDQQRHGYFGGFDIGVFNIENGSIDELEGYRGGDPRVVWPPPTWVLPTPC